MSQLLNGFGFSGYRSVGDEIIKIVPLQKINLIIGQNNSGKSNIVRFLHEHYADCLSAARGRKIQEGQEFADLDLHVSTPAAKLRVSFPITPGEELDSYISTLIPEPTNSKVLDLVERILKSPALSDEDGIVWFTYKAATPKGPFDLHIDDSLLKTAIDPSQWQLVWNVLTGKSSGSLDHQWFPESMARIATPPRSAPNVELIPAIRKIGEAGSQPDDHSGLGIIESLARLQNPPVSDQKLKCDFEAINQFVRNVLEEPEATIEIPYDRDMVVVHMNGRTLPLASLGTGIHEVIILASAATILKESVLCVEEPELHLHPLLQKKLLRYLNENTDNQYIFTTHSAHLLDAAPAEIFHVRSSKDRSVLTAITSTRERSQICVDLGYRASDILQANCVIWVEGPSDRVYLNHWLKGQNPNLAEGIHYSIMFYGGRLSSHLSGVDEDEQHSILDDFISLRRLNRNSVILLDSDKNNPRAKLNSTKLRLSDEFGKGPGFAWITKGREVENYLNEDHLDRCLKDTHASARCREATGQWANLLEYTEKRAGKQKFANKVKVARRYIDNFNPDFTVLDLKKQIDKLMKFIAVSNDYKI